jgi:hypothetical protein
MCSLRRRLIYTTLIGMPQGEQIDLFPWILGGLLIAVAVPAVIALTSTDEPSRVAKAARSPVHITQPAIEPVAPPAAIEPVSPPATIAPIQAVPTGQIWECVVNRQKTFSDSPCGADAAVHQLSVVNVMDAAPIRRTPAYPTYSPYPVDPAPYALDSTEQDAPDTNGSSATSQIIVINERERREHRPQTHHHEHRPGQVRN